MAPGPVRRPIGYRDLSGAALRDAGGKPIDRGVVWVAGDPLATSVHLALSFGSIALLLPSVLVGSLELLGWAPSGPVGELVKLLLGFESSGGLAVSAGTTAVLLLDLRLARRRPIHRIGVSASKLVLRGFLPSSRSYPWESVRWTDPGGLIVTGRRGPEHPIRLTDGQARAVRAVLPRPDW